jgi:hypothetical protein
MSRSCVAFALGNARVGKMNNMTVTVFKVGRHAQGAEPPHHFHQCSPTSIFRCVYVSYMQSDRLGDVGHAIDLVLTSK